MRFHSLVKDLSDTELGTILGVTAYALDGSTHLSEQPQRARSPGRLADGADGSRAKGRQDVQDELHGAPVLTNTGLLMEA